MEKQYLYILSNPRHEGLFKVGGTNRDPVVRADQLSRQTGVLGKFQVERSIVVPDWRIAEKMAHYLLREQTEEKEYFKLYLPQIVEILTIKLTQFFGLIDAKTHSGELLKRSVELKKLKLKADEVLDQMKAEAKAEAKTLDLLLRQELGKLEQKKAE